ncbi:Ubiquinone biosynthesis monooxygenase COQ6, mitochondrial [Rhizoctonia solani]|uniref:Ubiquinone biosynthesis monooxygenase COQ6, mitochondrial n=1 Tax=Rhizoctonia solani TaxID=456999 RepID=A0A8H7H827_9AGAM|nr:Ubiquinone biosynthesis monooxygenase COQ6, mitochondrial [Rhizoctonia solani]
MLSLRHCSKSARYTLRPRPLATLNRVYIRPVGYRLLSTSTSEDYDVVIIGGGPAGLALAAGLGTNVITSRLKIALVEASGLDKVRNWTEAAGQYSNRVSSLTNESVAFIHSTGAWEYVDTRRACPLEAMQVWDGISDARIHFSPSDLARLPTTGTIPGSMAMMTENLNLQQGLLRKLESVPNVKLLDTTKVEGIQSGPGDYNSWPVVNTSTGKSLRSRLLIGADGFNSPVRKFAGIESSGWAYDTHAVVATLFHSHREKYATLAHLEQPNSTAFQRFLTTGPIACLPLSPTASSLVWSTTPAIASALKASSPATLAIFVNAAFRLPNSALQNLYSVLLASHQKETPLSPEVARAEVQQAEIAHSIKPHDARASADIDSLTKGVLPEGSNLLPPLVIGIQDKSVAGFPLKYSHAETYIGTGQGARTVLVGDAAHTVHPLAGQGLNMGSYTALLPYMRARYMHNQSLLLATDSLHKLYGTTAPPIVWARSTGLEIINELSTIKGALMGVAGASPGNASTSWWHAAASGLEGLAGAGDVLRAVGGSLKDTLTKTGSSLIQGGVNALKNSGR